MASIIQDKIIEAIKHELSLVDEHYTAQPMFANVFFYPLLGIFMYADAPISHYDAYELIKTKLLVFDEITNHQGEQMVKYKFNSDYQEKQTIESLIKTLPNVNELREISKDRPDTFINGALYIIDLIDPIKK